MLNNESYNSIIITLPFNYSQSVQGEKFLLNQLN